MRWGAAIFRALHVLLGIVASFGVLVVILISFDRVSATLALATLLLAHPVHASARVNVIVHRPVRPLAAVGERTGNFLEAWVEREVVADRILSAPVSIRGKRAEIVNDGQQIKPLKQKQRR